MTSEEKALYDRVCNYASADLRKNEKALQAASEIYLKLRGTQRFIGFEDICACIEVAGILVELLQERQGADSTNAPPSYSTYGTAITNMALAERLRPLVESIRQEGWGSVNVPGVSTAGAVTQAGQSVAEFLRGTEAYRVAADLGITESAMTSLIVSGVVSLISAVEIHVRYRTSTLPDDTTVQRSQGVIEVNFPTDVPSAEYREIGSTTRKALGESQTKGFDGEDERLFDCMLHVDKAGQIPRHTNEFWEAVCEVYNTDLRAEDHKTWRALAARARRNGLRGMLPHGWGHGA